MNPYNARLKNTWQSYAPLMKQLLKVGGPWDIFVTKSMNWPQNFILTGSQKTRPTYDDLTITQWVSGFVRCIQEEKSEPSRSAMLSYLGNLMEDASDFLWDSTKACHAI